MNTANAKIGIDITATKISGTLRSMKRMLDRVFFSLKTRRHNRTMLIIIIAANVKQYKTCSITLLPLFFGIVG